MHATMPPLLVHKLSDCLVKPRPGDKPTSPPSNLFFVLILTFYLQTNLQPTTPILPPPI
jgi:hypothetical protein